ncbi:MAG: DUF4167 domain-containing protein [Hyphomonadaceae bacterium]
MKRQRGRGGGNNNGRRPGHSQNRTFDSNGPDVKVRGPAPHIYEKYLQLARDATSAGDRVMAENFLQHAEHYFRVIRAMQPAAPPPQFTDRYGDDFDGEGEEEGGEENAAAEADGQGQNPRHDYAPREQRGGYQPRGDYQQREPRGEYQPREQRGEHQPREYRGERAPREDQEAPREQEFQGEGGEQSGEQDIRRGRRRRGRFRPDGERTPRVEGESGGREEPENGFGDTLPAFLGND